MRDSIIFVFSLAVVLSACQPNRKSTSETKHNIADSFDASRVYEVGDLVKLPGAELPVRMRVAGQIVWAAPHGWLLEDRRCPVPRKDLSCPSVGLEILEPLSSSDEFAALERVVYSGGIGGVRTNNTILDVDVNAGPARASLPPEGKTWAQVNLVNIVQVGNSVVGPRVGGSR